MNWWYKNGEMRRDYFGIKYIYKNEVHTFYPDYLVEFTDGKIGIFETKNERAMLNIFTKAKNEALKNILKKKIKLGKTKNLLVASCLLKIAHG